MIPEAGEETLQAVLNGDAEAFRSILRSYQGQGSFERWLATIALRCCYERLRERYRPEAPFSSLARGEGRTGRPDRSGIVPPL